MPSSVHANRMSIPVLMVIFIELVQWCEKCNETEGIYGETFHLHPYTNFKLRIVVFSWWSCTDFLSRQFYLSNELKL